MGIEGGGGIERGPRKQVASIEGEPVSSIVETTIDESERYSIAFANSMEG